MLSLCGGGGGVGWLGLHSHYRVQPNCSVEVEVALRCVVIGVVTIGLLKQPHLYISSLHELGVVYCRFQNRNTHTHKHQQTNEMRHRLRYLRKTKHL